MNKQKNKDMKRVKECYEIEIHDKTARGIYVYIHKSTSFYNAFLQAKAIQRVFKSSWGRTTEIITIKKQNNENE